MSLSSFVRHLQGERRGMGSELKSPTPGEEAFAAALYPDLFIAPAITVQTVVGLADVSFWQGVINFIVMKAAGLFGVIIRAGQRNWEDIKFKINWMLAKLAGLPRGSYFFYDSREDPRKQAELWWSLLDGDVGELPHAADFEESYGGAYGTRAHFKEFLLRFQELSRLPDDRIVIYTGFFWWLARVGDDPWFRRYKLWLASYGAMSTARIPAPWQESELLFWQYTSSGNGTAYGVSSREIDLNWYTEDAISFTRRFGLMEPPGNGETMARYTVRSDFHNMTLRPEHNTGALGTESVPAGTTMHADEIWTATADLWKVINGVNKKVNAVGDRWAHVVNVGGVAKDSWVAIVHLGVTYCNSVIEVNPPEVPTISLTHTIEVYSDGSIRVDGSPYP